MDETQKLPPPVTVRDIFRILRRRAIVALFTFLLVVGVTLYFTSKMRKVYEAETRILLDGNPSPAASTNILEMVTRRGGESLDIEIEKIRSRSFLVDVIERAKLKTDPDELRGRLFIGDGPGGRILAIRVRAETAEESRLIAKTVAERYIAMMRQDYEEKIDLSQERLVAAQETARREKVEAEAALNAFNAKAGLSDPGILYRDRVQQTVATRTQLEDSRRALGLQQKALRDLEEQLKRIPPTMMMGFALEKNPVINDYRSQIVNLETQKKKLLFDYAPDSDEVIAIDQEIKTRRDAIEAAEKDMFSKGSRSIGRNPDYSKVQSAIHDTTLAIEGNQNNIAALAQRLGRLEAEQKRFAPQQLVYEGLKRKRDGANEAFEQARLGKIQTEINRLLSAPNPKVLDEAILPPLPVSPKPVLNLVMAICLGLFLGGGMALLAEYMSSGSVAAEDFDINLPTVGGVPLLGTIPIALPTPEPLINNVLPAPLRSAGQRAGYAEDALREIGYALAHRHPRDPVPVILLTGTRSDDSTAALAAQLTATLVRDGMRVTLVDADRNKPRLNRVFGKPDAPGLADVLAGRKKVREILYNGADGSLRFLAAGSPDDQTPFREAGLKSVFHELAADRDTDLVVISGPSVWQTPLIAPLEKAANGMALIAPDGAPDESVARVRRLLSNGYKPRLLGVIVGSDTPLVPGVSAERELAEVRVSDEEKSK